LLDKLPLNKQIQKAVTEHRFRKTDSYNGVLYVVRAKILKAKELWSRVEFSLETTVRKVGEWYESLKHGVLRQLLESHQPVRECTHSGLMELMVTAANSSVCELAIDSA
jgi:hypothetical protein